MDHQELSISFGNVPISSSPTVEIILPTHLSGNGGNSNTRMLKSSPAVNLPPPNNSADPIIMSASHENLEYVPISFGAFEAAPMKTGFEIQISYLTSFSYFS